MDSKAKLAIVLAVISTVGAVGGGSFVLDFSNNISTNTENSLTNNNDNSQTIINEGDTIINEIISEAIDEEALFDLGYDYFCEEVDPMSPECDEYWGEE